MPDPRDRVTRSEGEPHDRLTRLCAWMTRDIEDCPDWREGDRVIAFANDQERGAVHLHGYDEDVDAEAVADLFIHLRAMFNSIGKELLFAPIQGPPEEQ